MKCNCCFINLEEEMAICPCCGFPTLGNRDEGVQGIALQFRNAMLKDISIAVKTYQYRYNNDGDLEEEKSDYVTVAQAPELKFGEIVWFGDEFRKLEVYRKIDIEISVRKENETSHFTLQAAPDSALSCSKLGLFLDEGLLVRLAVGNQEHYVLTENGASLLNFQYQSQEA